MKRAAPARLPFAREQAIIALLGLIANRAAAAQGALAGGRVADAVGYVAELAQAAERLERALEART